MINEEKPYYGMGLVRTKPGINDSQFDSIIDVCDECKSLGSHTFLAAFDFDFFKDQLTDKSV